MIRLLIVDPARPMREMMAIVLRDELDIRVVGCAGSVEQALTQLDAGNMILVSASLPQNGACELIIRATHARPNLKILAIDVPDIQTGVNVYLAAGAANYVLEDESVDSLLKKVRAAHSRHANAQPASA